MIDIIYERGQNIRHFIDKSSNSIVQVATHIAVIRNTFELYECIKEDSIDFDTLDWLTILITKDITTIKMLLTDVAEVINRDNASDDTYFTSTSRITVEAQRYDEGEPYYIDIHISTM